MLKVNDKIKYVKTNWLIDMPIGTIMTVTDISGTTVSCNADYKVNGNKVGTFKVVMSYSEIEKYFEKVNEDIEKTKPKNIWSGWKTIRSDEALWYVRNIYNYNNNMSNIQYLFNKYLATSNIKILYRTKGKQIQVMFRFANKTSIISNAKCNTKGGDVFDIRKGVGLGILRCFVKTIVKDLDNIVSTL